MLPKIFTEKKHKIVGLAPMDGVTDSAFRQIVKKYGNPDLIFTEFEHVNSIINAPDKVLKTLYYDEIERPIIGQIYGNNPDNFYKVAKVLCAMGFDGIDINMGCPAKNVANSGAGAGLIKTPDLAVEIIKAVKNAVDDWSKNPKLDLNNFNKREYILKTIQAFEQRSELCKDKIKENNRKGWYGINNLVNTEKKQITVSVKTRLGYDKPITETWIKKISTAEPDWISLHGRTLKQMYNPSANWDEIAIAVKSTNIPIIANGDVQSLSDFHRIIEQTKSYGVLIGRASFGNPWIFKEIQENKVNSSITIKKKVQIMLEHAKIYTSIYDNNTFFTLRKHFAWYISGIPNAKSIREKLVRVSNIEELETITKEFHLNE